ncbi:hypothetical protein DSO57_1010849 [Entomophthora muscae]|uniref:Uncharacterized protein n=1 Tax=Entomophthora muscae TaxID=34485 RepID=A0ACC2RXJ3_9FUNG|nr:hypothetical protein DSO57_1010849 [Entomophthora muscae]
MSSLISLSFFTGAAITAMVGLYSQGFANDTQLELQSGFSWSGGRRSLFDALFQIDLSAKGQPNHALKNHYPQTFQVTKTREGFCICGPKLPHRVSTLACGLEAVQGNTISFTTDAPLHNVTFEEFKSMINPIILSLPYVQTASFSSSSNKPIFNPIVWLVKATLEYPKGQRVSFRAIFPIAYNSNAVVIYD